MKSFLYNGEVVESGAQRLFVEPRCCVGVAVGLGVAGLAAGVYSAYSQSQAQKKAAQEAQQSQQNANNLNYQMFQESRGSGGNAVLPLYLTNPNGSPFEGTLGQDLISAYDSSSVPLSTFRAATAPMGAAQQGANRLTNNLFTGGITREMQRTAAPVEAARMATARSSAMDALSRTLASIDAAQAGRGFSGDSLAGRELQFQAQNTMGQQVGAANLQNLQEQADISNYGNITLPLQNINLPISNASNAANLAYLPDASWLQSLNQRMQPFNFLRIGTTQPFTYQPLPVFNTGGGTGGAIAGAIAQGAGTGLQYYQQQQQNKNTQNLLAQLSENNLNQYGLGVNGPNSAAVSSYAIAQDPALLQSLSAPVASDGSLAGDVATLNTGTSMFGSTF